MRHAEVDLITLEERIDEVLELHYGEPKSYTTAQVSDNEFLSANENFYNKLNIEGEAEKPSFDSLIFHLGVIKDGLKKDISDNLYNSVNISKLHIYLNKLGVQFSEYEQHVRSKADSDDQLFFDLCIEQQDLYDVIKKDEAAIEFGNKVDEICKRAIRLLMGMNVVEKGLSTSQISQMKEHFKGVHDLLKDGEPSAAYLELQLVSPLNDAGAPAENPFTIVTQDDIDRFANFLNREIGALSGT